MTENPPPRPALQRSTDGAVLPALPNLRRPAALTVNPELPASKGKKHKPTKDDHEVELVVALPRAVRKQLRRKAEAHGYTAEEAAARLITAWLEA
jgi:hypothetical protein